MGYRILHCGNSLENYRLCLENKVAGFLMRVVYIFRPFWTDFVIASLHFDTDLSHHC